MIEGEVGVTLLIKGKSEFFSQGYNLAIEEANLLGTLCRFESGEFLCKALYCNNLWRKGGLS